MPRLSKEPKKVSNVEAPQAALPTLKPYKTSTNKGLTGDQWKTAKAATYQAPPSGLAAALSAALSPVTALNDQPFGGRRGRRAKRRTEAQAQPPATDEEPLGAGGSARNGERRAQADEQPTLGAGGSARRGRRRSSAQEQRPIQLANNQERAKRVRFAPGPLSAPAAGADGHPTQEGRVARPVRYLDSPFSRGKNVTKKDVRELEEWLEGPEYEPSLTKLKVRVGLLPAAPLMRPHATATRQRR
ncbi:hypothetical protein CHLRE_06g272475v5 [Chlamydomonas reinhardtii]|uniref:Uncharacterized protein n=1 Tax=Chlamydomonas reinhardtii TaxID=3055 RepID=A8HVR7_CHLRE|nr:uncharacterized protein CHLRE_06g272475v5 [Chlamydomonas reinhardtii]PNW82069.1 hypothetical protein CHLRE_06g272475v5 [Chlamydomonas reinhardtii]|eukprot:XP_001696203.1 predicted protein [Chlamydomonas reinhardtii]